jgi:hypothetical protein
MCRLKLHDIENREVPPIGSILQTHGTEDELWAKIGVVIEDNATFEALQKELRSVDGGLGGPVTGHHIPNCYGSTRSGHREEISSATAPACDTVKLILAKKLYQLLCEASYPCPSV